MATFTKNLWTVSILKNGTQILSESETVTIVPLGGTYTYNIEISGGVTLALNDYFEVRLTGQAIGGAGYNANIQNTLTVAPGGVLKIGSTIPVAVDVVEGDTMKINYTMYEILGRNKVVAELQNEFPVLNICDVHDWIKNVQAPKEQGYASYHIFTKPQTRRQANVNTKGIPRKT